jgi:phosphoribosyl 1,2-cyclic phosphodiesterase
MLRFASLGSGSEGNALIVEVGETRLMLDCGFSLAETELRLGRLGLAPTDVSAILVTHEHGDHIRGAGKFARKHRIPVWLTYGTLASQADNFFPPELVREIDSHAPFAIDDVEVFPFPVPHDAREPAQFVFGDGALRFGVLTDVGGTTPHIESMLSGLNGLMLEANHDTALLQQSAYPASLKERIGGRFGHLSNSASATLLSKLDCGALQHCVAAHLSRQNNSPDHARAALAPVLGCVPEWIGIADQQNGLDWRTLV